MARRYEFYVRVARTIAGLRTEKKSGRRGLEVLLRMRVSSSAGDNEAGNLTFLIASPHAPL